MAETYGWPEINIRWYLVMYVCVYIYIYTGVPGGKDLTSGECTLGQTIPI